MLIFSTGCLLVSALTLVLHYTIRDEIFRLMVDLAAIGCLLLSFLLAPLSFKLLAAIAVWALISRLAARRNLSHW